MMAGASGLLAAPSIARSQTQNGVALVIGNSKYKWEASLPNVQRDAPDIAKRFQAMGLQTTLLQDADQNAMKRALATFTSRCGEQTLRRSTSRATAPHGCARPTSCRWMPI